MKEWLKIAEHQKNLVLLDTSIATLMWDMETQIPAKAHQWRSQQLAQLAEIQHSMEIDAEYAQYLEAMQDETDLDQVQRRQVTLGLKRHKQAQCFPAEFVVRKTQITAEAHSIWAHARQKQDFSLFEKSLSQIVDIARQETDFLGYKDKAYDALLDLYEPGLTVAQLDPIFNDLGEYQSNLLGRIMKKNTGDVSPILGDFPIAQQKELGLLMQEWTLYDRDAGRIDEAQHPFCTTLGSDDVRITTRYEKDNFSSNLYSVLHELGHALYEQGIASQYAGTLLDTGVSLGIHESQSRYWENMVGRSKAFCALLLPELKRLFAPQLDGLTEQELYRCVNHVEKNLIRVESDEVVYNLHIILRYEVEKALIHKEIAVKDLPHYWNELSEKYLGLRPSNDSEGVLQDVHWSGGAFGYFPTYALGNLYSAQFHHTFSQQHQLTALIKNKQFSTILDWQRQHIHSHGALYTPAELCLQTTHEKLTARYYKQYLENKYAQLYQL